LNWKALLKDDLVNWLLSGDPWVVYRTLIDLLERDEGDKRALAARMSIAEHPLIEKIFEGINQYGYWGGPKDISYLVAEERNDLLAASDFGGL
jgi:hypothetical protein